MASKVSWTSTLTIALFVCSLTLLAWQPDRSEFTFLITCYTVAFTSYLLLLNKFSFKSLLIIGGIAHLGVLFFQPHLSIDHFRFLWDGEMAWLGINPFDFRPTELINQPFIAGDPYYETLYEGVGSMSQRNYSIYPTINQVYFLIATAFSNNIYINTIILKLLILATQVVGGIYLVKLFKMFNVNTSRVWLLYLNPLWIIETVGNTHFEGVMISLLIIAFYYVFVKRLFLGSVWFAMAVQIKLIPLLLLPFFLRFYGFIKALKFYSLVILIVLVVGVIHIQPSNVDHFLQSLRLYFKVFEFNSFILFYGIEIGRQITGWNEIKLIGPMLSYTTLVLVNLIALKSPTPDWNSLFRKMTLGYMVYLLLSSTLHPWYILPLLFLSIFTEYTFAIIWSFLIFLSYYFYSIESSADSTYRMLVIMEYILLFAAFFYEIFKRSGLFKQLSVSNNLTASTD